MSPSREELAERFNGLSDEELARRAGAGTLTELAQEVAVEELKQRGMALPAPPPVASPSASTPEACTHAGFVLLSTYLDPVEAQTMRARLEAEGIPSLLGSAHYVQATTLLAPALGGVRVEVPGEYAKEARRLLADLEAGRLALDPDPVADAEPVDDSIRSTDRRRLRALVLDAIVLGPAIIGLLLVAARGLYLWNRYAGAVVLPPWLYALSVTYFMAALLFVWRSKWSIPLYLAHLVGTQAAAWITKDPYFIGSEWSAVFTGLILYYSFGLLKQGKLR